MNARLHRPIPPVTLILLGLILLPALPGLSRAEGYIGLYAKSNSANVLDRRNAFEGITVTRIVENSPAEAAGLRVGDILLRAGEKSLTDPNQLYALARTGEAGTTIRIRYERQREVMEADLVTVAKVGAPAEEETARTGTKLENRLLGFEFKSAPPERTTGLELEPGQGIEVVRLAKGSPLEGEIEPGEIIVEADEAPVLSAEGFLEYLEKDPEADRIKLRVANEKGRMRTERVKFHKPKRETREFKIPLIYNFKREPNATTWAIPFLFTKRERLEGATKWRILGLIKFETGDSEELLEVDTL